MRFRAARLTTSRANDGESDMAPEFLPCDSAVIEDLLTGRLHVEDQSRLESHLDACPACRRRLEESAADDEQWRDAATLLRDDELDLALSGVEDLSADAEWAVNAGAEARRIMAYFDPTDDPRMLGRFGGYEVVGVVGC